MRQILFLIGVGTLLLFMTLTSTTATPVANGDDGWKPVVGPGRIHTEPSHSSMVSINDEEDMVAMEDSTGSHESVAKVVMTRQLFGDDIPTTRPLSGNYLAYYIGFPHPSSRTEGKAKQLNLSPKYAQEKTFTNNHEYLYTGGDAAKLFQYPTSYIPFKNQPKRERGNKQIRKVNKSEKQLLNKNKTPSFVEVSYNVGPETESVAAESSSDLIQIVPHQQPLFTSVPVPLQFLPLVTPVNPAQMTQYVEPGIDQFLPIPAPAVHPVAAPALAPANPLKVVPVPVIKHTPTGIKQVVSLPEIASITATVGHGKGQGSSDLGNPELQEIFGHSRDNSGPSSGSLFAPNENGISFSFDFIHEPRASTNTKNKNTFDRRHQNVKQKHHQKNQQQHQQVNMQRRDESQIVYQYQLHSPNQQYSKHQRQQFQQQLAQATLNRQYQLQHQQQQISVPVSMPYLQRHLLNMRGMLSRISPLFSHMKVNHGQIQVPTYLSTAAIVQGGKLALITQQHQQGQFLQQQQQQPQQQFQLQQEHEHPQQSKHQQKLQSLQKKQKYSSNGHHGNVNRMLPIGYKLAYEQPTSQSE